MLNYWNMHLGFFFTNSKSKKCISIQKQLWCFVPYLITFFPFGPSFSPVSPQTLRSIRHKMEKLLQLKNTQFTNYNTLILYFLYDIELFIWCCAHLWSRSTRWSGLTIFSIFPISPWGPFSSWGAPVTPFTLSDTIIHHHCRYWLLIYQPVRG